MREATKNWSLLLLVTVCSLVIGLVCLELILRSGQKPPSLLPSGDSTKIDASRDRYGSVGEYDRVLGWHLKPGARGRMTSKEFDVELRINNKGLRSDVEYPYIKPVDKKRIVILGDSFTFGHGVNNNDTYSTRLQDYLSCFEVLNLGVSAYGTDQQFLMLKREGLKYSPDIVILGLYKGDVFRNGLSVFNGKPKPLFHVDRSGALQLTNVPVPREVVPDQATLPKFIEDSKVYKLVKSRGTWLFEHYGFGESWETTGAIIEEMRSVVEGAGSKFVVVIIPTESMIHGNSLVRTIQTAAIDNIRTMLENKGITQIDLTPYLIRSAKFRPEVTLYYPVDGHFAPGGHFVTAEEIHRFLVNHGFVGDC